ncbi:MAG: IclR family transcriptional regulator [Hyphomicrobiaceae bacterium]|nr:IclR family transcriptional regulator [Hyphomicrobiaceae bacterium]
MSGISLDAKQSQPAKGVVPAVARAVRLLNVLAAAKEPLSLASLTTQLGLPKSTVHGLCTTLVQSGLVIRFEGGTYHIGTRVMDLAHAFLARSDVTTEFRRIIDALDPLPEESIVLSVLDGPDIVYVACRNGSRPFNFNFHIGMRLPANCAASGKALLSSLHPDKVAERARNGSLVRMTPNSITELEPLLRQLAEVRERGYAIDNEETRIGIICYGAPVYRGSQKDAVAAIGVSMPKATVDPEQQAATVQAIKKVAAELSMRLGPG